MGTVDGPDDLLAERMRVLDTFARAWSQHDIDTLMSLVTDDCVYSASVGPDPGETFVGREAVRNGFLRLLAYDADGRSCRALYRFLNGRFMVALIM